MSARALDALSQLDPMTQLVVGQVYGFTGDGPKSATLVSAEMGLTLEEVSKMLEDGLRTLAGYKKKIDLPDDEDIIEKKTLQIKKPILKLVKSDHRTALSSRSGLKIA